MKNKSLFIVGITFSVLLLIFISYFVKKYYPTVDIYSSLAIVISVAIPLWKMLFPKIKPKEYHISAQKLVGSVYWQGKQKVLIEIQNTGEVSVNIKFRWLETDSGIRFTFSDLLDSRGKDINSSIWIKPHGQEEVVAVFNTDDPKWNTVSENITDAANKKDLRLVDGIKDMHARLVWSDTSPSSKEVQVPLGWWLYDRVNDDLKK